MTESVQDILYRSTVVLDQHKGRDIVCLDLTGIHSYLEYFVIVTGQSYIHCRSLAREVMELCCKKGREKKSVPHDTTGWVVLDYGDIVFHIFVEEQRNYYNLERLWSDADRIETDCAQSSSYA